MVDIATIPEGDEEAWRLAEEAFLLRGKRFPSTKQDRKADTAPAAHDGMKDSSGYKVPSGPVNPGSYW